MPTSTVLGGVWLVPMAVRRKDREMIYRVNEVVITSREGNRAIIVVRKRISSVCTLSPLILIKLSVGIPSSPRFLLLEYGAQRLAEAGGGRLSRGRRRH